MFALTFCFISVKIHHYKTAEGMTILQTKVWTLQKKKRIKRCVFWSLPIIIGTNDVPSFGAEPCEWQIQLIWAYLIWLLSFLTWIKAHFTFQINAGCSGLNELQFGMTQTRWVVYCLKVSLWAVKITCSQTLTNCFWNDVITCYFWVFWRINHQDLKSLFWFNLTHRNLSTCSEKHFLSGLVRFCMV